MLAPRESNEGLKIVEDATCTFCGCLCDDIRLEIAGNRIAHATNACALGETWFCADEGEPDSICLIDGEAGAVEDGIDRTAQILANAKYPLVHGLGHTITRRSESLFRSPIRSVLASTRRVAALVELQPWPFRKSARYLYAR